jgi:hypothetical protein
MRQRGQRWRLTLTGLIAAVLSGLLSPLHAAPSCDHFKAAIVEGAAHYGLPAPTFTLVHVNEADANVTNWNIATFDDVRSMISCWHGAVLVFAVNAGNAEIKSSFHILLLAAIGLHAYGMDWRQALNLRADMVRAAKTSMTAYAAIDGAKASLAISIANTPSFQIEADD